MKRIAIILACAPLLLLGCGGEDGGGGAEVQIELADLLLAQEIVGADAECVRDKTAELSDEDAQFLVENVDATDTEGFSTELQNWALSLIDCIDLDEQNSDG